MLLGWKWNLWRPQSRKLFSSRFINVVHLAHALIMVLQNDLQHVYYIHSWFWRHLVKMKKKRKQVSRCSLMVVVQVIIFTFVIFLFMYDRNINKKQTTGNGLWKYVTGNGLWKSLSWYHLIIFLKLPAKWICLSLQSFLAEKTRKSHSYLVHGIGKALVQEVQPVLS